MSEIKPVAHAFVVDGECEQIEWGVDVGLPDDKALVMLYTADALAAARDAALEAAAKVCDDARTAWAQKHGNPTPNAFDAGHVSAYLMAADAIRSLKGPQQ